MDKNVSIWFRIEQLIALLAQQQSIIDQKDFCKKTGIGESALSRIKKKPKVSETYIERIVAVFPQINPQYLRGDAQAKPFLRGDVESDFIDYEGDEIILDDEISAMRNEIDRLKAEIDKLKKEKDCDCCCRNIPIIPSRLVGEPDLDVLEHMDTNIESFDKVKVGNGLPSFDYFVRVVSSGLTDYVQKGDLLALRKIDDITDLRWGLDAVVVDTKRVGMIPGFITEDGNDKFSIIPLDRKHPNTIISKDDVLSLSKIIGLLRVGL